MVAGIPADTPVSPTNGLCSVEKGGKVVRVCVGVGGGTWYTTKRGPFLDFAVGRIQACVMSLPHTVEIYLFQRLVYFVNLKKKKKKHTKIENYRSRMGKSMALRLHLIQ